MIEAKYYEKLENNKIRCVLCPQNCIISEGMSGFCLARKNIEGTLYSLGYGKITSEALDPIEKKPLYHFCPGDKIYSVGSFGCNLSCKFCQNHSIAREMAPFYENTAMELVDNALSLKINGNIGLAFTYNEPFINFEFVLETLKLAKKKYLKTILVTNGFVNMEPLMEIIPHVDAMNIDLKSYDQEGFKLFCNGKLKYVKDTIKFAAAHCHVEITTLIVPGLNDDVVGIESLAKWISGIDKNIPYHISRFFPKYQMKNESATNVEIIEEAQRASKKHLNYVYTGNL